MTIKISDAFKKERQRGNYTVQDTTPDGWTRKWKEYPLGRPLNRLEVHWSPKQHAIAIVERHFRDEGIAVTICGSWDGSDYASLPGEYGDLVEIVLYDSTQTDTAVLTEVQIKRAETTNPRRKHRLLVVDTNKRRVLEVLFSDFIVGCMQVT